MDGEVEAHPGCWGEYVCGVSGEDGAACPVVIGDGSGHGECADVGDLDGQVGDSGGRPDEGGASFLVIVFEALAPFGVPWDAADPAVGGVGGTITPPADGSLMP
jgi:hypothetical protein